MGRSEFSKALFAGALTLTAANAVHARTVVFLSEARDDMTFSNAVVDTTATGVSFDLSGTSTADDGKKTFGEFPLATSPLGVTTAALNGGSVFGWDLDAKTTLNHQAHRHEVDAVEPMNFHGKHGLDVSPVSAIPEPPTYAMLAAGLAGVAIITRRRRRGRR